MIMMKLISQSCLNRIVLGSILLASILLTTACSNNLYLDTPKSDVSEEQSFQSSITETTAVPKLGSSNEIIEKGINQTYELLKSYIAFAQIECEQALKHGTECIISLQDVFGDEKPELILTIKSDFSFYAGDYYFTTNKNGDPVYMGSCFIGHDKYYTDGKYVYSVKNLDAFQDAKIFSLSFNKIDEQIYAPNAPDLAKYSNSDASTFINDINWFFLRYDDDDCFINSEKYAAMFYYEDSGLYEAYLVSTQMLDLTGIKIGDIINEDGNLIHANILEFNYLISRQEYECIQFRFFEMLTEVTEEPQISSGLINLDDINNWLDSLY